MCFLHGVRLLFNLLLGRKEMDVEDLMQVVQIESMQNVHA
jgi:hypothetical protein